jgi:non-homologous end joining protein Ku
MAASLIDTMTEDFEPDQLEAVVEAKVAGNDIVRPSGLDLPDAKKQPADLTEILRASVAAVKGGRGKPDGAEDDDQEDAKSGGKAKARRKASA